MKKWGSGQKFKIRDDVTFDDGDPLTLDDVVRSLQRIAFLSKQKNVRNGFIENLKGLDELKTAYSPNFVGISQQDNWLVIQLNRPVPDLLDLLSFGLYGIVKKSNFDSESGMWITNPLQFHGAGPYLLERFEKEQLIFRLRDAYPLDLLSEDPFNKIFFRFGARNWKEADLFLGARDQEKIPQNLSFYSAGESSIRYFLIHSWKRPGGPLSTLKDRLEFRAFFYSELEKKGYVAIKSFFPTIIGGINEIYSEMPKVLPPKKRSGRFISFVDFRPLSTRNSEAAVDAIEAAIKMVGAEPIPKKDVTFEEAVENKDYDKKSFLFDIAFYTTEISLVEPRQDIKLMFSANGINLPDSSGEIKKELERKDFSIQKINKQLMEQSIVIPAFQAEQGVWASRKVSFDRYNTALLLGELQWLTVRR